MGKDGNHYRIQLKKETPTFPRSGMLAFFPDALSTLLFPMYFLLFELIYYRKSKIHPIDEAHITDAS